MAVNTQFSIAVHVMAGLANRCGEQLTSTHLAQSVNTSASFVRRVTAKLSKAGLIHATTGQAGACRLARQPEAISLLEIYRAVGAPKAFAIHHYAPQNQCMVSCNIKAALEKVLDKTQKSMEATLKKISLREVLAEMAKK